MQLAEAALAVVAMVAQSVQLADEPLAILILYLFERFVSDSCKYKTYLSSKSELKRRGKVDVNARLVKSVGRIGSTLNESGAVPQ